MSENFISKTCKINSIVLTNYNGNEIDITNLVLDVDIYESIYVNTISGTLNILDSNQLINFFPIVGEEHVSIDINLPGNDDNENFILKDFRIYKISDRNIRNDKIESYKLHFISKESLENIQNKLCKAWQGEVTSVMIKDIFKTLNSSKTLEVENTIGLHNFISPNFNPLQALNYLASHRSINENKLSDFAFFESLDVKKKTSKFNFKSMGSLANQQPVAEFTYRPAMTSNPTNINVQPFNIENISFRKGFDLFENKAKGFYNQTYIYYDMLRKSYQVMKSTYEDIFNETKGNKLEKTANKQFVNNSDTFSEFVEFVHVSQFPNKIDNNRQINNTYNKGLDKNRNRKSNSYISSKKSNIDFMSNLHEETLHRRNVLLQEFENNKIIINEISGNYNYTVGATILFKKPNIVLNKQDIIDKYGSNEDMFISGNYLISKSRHHITRQNGVNWSYINTLEISKNTSKSDYSKL